MRRLIFICAVMVVLVPSLSFAATQYKIDKTHTTLLFTIDHMGYSKTVGFFRDVQGIITFDVDSPVKSSAEVVVNLDSVDTNDSKRDEYLKGPKVFNVAKNPTMTYKVKDVIIDGNDAAKITGDLTLNGVTKPVMLNVKYNKAGMHPIFNDTQAIGFSASGKLKRDRKSVV